MDEFGWSMFCIFIGVCAGVLLTVPFMEVADKREDEVRELEMIELKSEVEVYKKILKEHYVVEGE